MSQLYKDILTAFEKWNPLDVPQEILEDEYKTYMLDLLSIEKNFELILDYLINKILEKKMDIKYSKLTELQKNEVLEIAENIHNAKQKAT